MFKTISYKRYLNDEFISSGPKDFIRDQVIKGRNHFWSTTGRNGLRILFKSLNLKKGDRVMLPAFAAHGIVLPIKDLGIEIEYYRSDRNMCPDYQDVEQKIKKNGVKVIFVIHYFGYPQEVDQIFELARSFGVVSIEDCAQAFYSSYNNGTQIGSKGDVALYSLTKFLPVPDGSLFVLNSNRLDPIIENMEFSTSFKTDLAVLIGRMQLFLSKLVANSKIKASIFIFSILYKLITPLHYWLICFEKKPVSISKYSLSKLKKLDIESIMRKRKQNASYLHEQFHEDVRFLYKDFKDEYSLTGFPIIAKDRKRIINSLMKNNIKPLVYNKLWWFVPKERTNEFKEEYNFLNNHLLLPIHENLGRNELNRMISSLKSILK